MIKFNFIVEMLIIFWFVFQIQERIQALSHQNAELKKRVIWNLGQEPARNSKHKHHQHRHKNPEEAADGEADHSSSSDNGFLQLKIFF